MTAPDGSFAALKQAIIARTGHDYYADKDRLLRDRLERRLTVTRAAGLPDYARLLHDPVAGAAEWEELEAEITIGETFFFRHAEQFAALKDVILPAIIAENQAARRIRIWSAGCAVGAEPYSLAILMERILGEALADWTIEIIGSDINHRCLTQAREGRFSGWALRGMTEAEKKRDFRPGADGRHWLIDPRHQPRTRFLRHNLLSLLDGTSPPEFTDFDLILCRNVLIYFGPDQVPGMLSALADCLKPSGWLMVGHSDAVVGVPEALGVVQLPGTLAFRPPGVRPPECVPPAPLPVTPAPVARPAFTLEKPARRSRPPEPEPEPVAVDPVPIPAIRALADLGALDEAAAACVAAIAVHPLDHRLYFYEGVIAQAQGDMARAEAGLRRAIYLRNDMVMAYYHLGLLLIDGTARDAGRRVMEQVVTLCAGLPPSEILPESDNLRPGDLRGLVGQRLRLIGAP
jgi:chemotaxis protein methyltransferase CheR